MNSVRLAMLCLPLWVMGCAPLQTPPTAVNADLPAQWQAPLPHNGQLTDLNQWWQRLGDPLLVEMIEAAQAASPSMATATSRIAQARATQAASRAALGPTLDASLSASRSVTQPGVPVATLTQGGLQAAWEIDLFGGNRAASDAARAREDSAQAQWHDARVSVAAEVANQYIGHRSCHVQLVLSRQDAASRAETARLSGLTTRAGFTAPAQDALARASAAEAANRVTQQVAQCDVTVKGLVALTALPEPELRQKLAPALYKPVQDAEFSVATIPARALAQRPDVYSAERNVAAASLDVASSDAQRYPRLALSGSIGAMSYNAGGISSDFTTWSIGPLALSLPLFDGGRRSANVQAAKARYDEAAALYRARVRQAVREVEEALVNLQSTSARGADTQIAADGYRDAFKAAQARYSSGLASLPDLEDARRTALNADIAALSLLRERQLAWVALYRAIGGGWQAPSATSAAAY